MSLPLLSCLIHAKYKQWAYLAVVHSTITHVDSAPL